ncbi:hypothetical protein C943_00331 [Mariniradius saccharolyticus AK6]|uniref:Uncharacterized protein n=1 Tax=Mariniradius saccharolyticus AK6 TaxID=1239962 RepID=M7XDT9_9BACT|nr:hypothetical protein C943_00331 [Mariniradius saccharolyticus AK6]
MVHCFFLPKLVPKLQDFWPNEKERHTGKGTSPLQKHAILTKK